MSDYYSSNVVNGGKYDAGIVLNETVEGIKTVQRHLVVRDDFIQDNELVLTIQDQISFENGEEDETIEDLASIIIPEDLRSQFAKYLREVADMIEREIPGKIKH